MRSLAEGMLTHVWPMKYLLGFVFALAIVFPAAAVSPNAVAEEAAKIMATGGRATRAGDLLSIRSANGTVAQFRNEHMCGENGTAFDFDHCRGFVFLGYMPAQRAFLVVEGLYEGWSFRWINADNGQVVTLPDEPVVSPDGAHFVLIGGGGADWSYAGMQVWRTDGPTLFKDMAEGFDGFYFHTFRKWVDEATVEIDVSMNVDEYLSGNQLSISGLTMLLRNDHGEWRVVPPPMNTVCDFAKAQIRGVWLCINPVPHAAGYGSNARILTRNGISQGITRWWWKVRHALFGKTPAKTTP